MMIISSVNNKELSPCIRNCGLDENYICVGCNRSISEIMSWRDIPDSQKKVILARCSQRKVNF
jgi:predicted Fe-S protein YdhL (DUF1289 family)